MAADHLPPLEGDESIVQTIERLHAAVRAQAAAEVSDRRRVGMLNALSVLLEQPRRAADLLVEYDATRQQPS